MLVIDEDFVGRWHPLEEIREYVWHYDAHVGIPAATEPRGESRSSPYGIAVGTSMACDDDVAGFRKEVAPKGALFRGEDWGH